MSAPFNAAILEAAGKYIGLEEWPGAQHNPEILEMFHRVGHGWVKDDETPWCAAFTGSVLAELGIPGTGKLNARSYETWGEAVSLRNARPGDIVVLSRPPKPANGHVAILVGFNGDRVILRGGNQGNKVSDASYPASRIVAIRRAVALGQAESNRPVLREGARGAFVLDLQDQLARLGYFAGKKDGDFGPMTAAAVRDFQNRQGMVVDGIVGAKTWATLEAAAAKPARDVSLSDLRASGSQTIKGASAIDVTAGLAGVATTVDMLSDVTGKASGLLPTVTMAVREHWPALIVLAALGAVLLFSDKIKVARLRDAQTGANVKR